MNQTSLLPPSGSHFISLTKAIDMTTRFRAQKENILDSNYRNQGIIPVCETFNRSDIDTLLGKQDCKALRVYLGMDENLEIRLIIVAVNEQAEDILPLSSVAENNEEEEDIVEEGHRCPVICPPSSPLNT